MPNMKRWSDTKLEKELFFAKAALDNDNEATKKWLDAIMAEFRRRRGVPPMNLQRPATYRPDYGAKGM